MKRCLHLIVMALIAVSGFAQQTGDVIYVYQKDSTILPLLREEILEMAYTIEDVGDLSEYESTMQWIVTADSTYKIPIIDIDSISFVTPSTVYQPDATRIEQGLMDYVLGSDSLTFFVDKRVPAKLLPKVGDKLVTVEMNDKFPIGFAGRVSTVSDADTAYVVECDAVGLEEVFKYYYNVTGFSDQESAASRRVDIINKQGGVSFAPDPIVVDFSKELDDKIEEGDFVLSGEQKLRFTFTPKFNIRASIIVHSDLSTKITSKIVTDLSVLSEMGVYGKMEWTPDWYLPKDIKLARIPIPYFPFICVYFNPGGYARFKGEITAGLTDKLSARAQTSFEFDSKRKPQKKPTFSIKMTGHQFKPDDISLNGSLEGGFLFDLGLNVVDSKIAKFCITGHVGPEVSSKFIFHPYDVVNAAQSTTLYEKLKDVTVDTKFAYNFSIDYGLGKEFGDDLNGTLVTLWKDKVNIAKTHVVPTFSNLDFQRSGTTGDASATVYGTCLAPIKVGFIVAEKDGNNVDSWNANDMYKDVSTQINTSFTGLNTDKEYVLNPKVVLFDNDIKATPSVELEKIKFPVRIINFEQTGAYYSSQKGYEYDGKNYYYKFNVTTTVELDKEATDIKDWGYIYHDIYGEDKMISCANLGANPYPDVRYAYYYNQTERTVELSPYVLYEGETKIKEGNRLTFMVRYVIQPHGSCPDENHPHAIDLGLPSGTLWACCNVGASNPNEFGDYYQWGATEPIGNTNLGYFGELTELGGTEYDISHLLLGGWQTPSATQLYELYEECDFKAMVVYNSQEMVSTVTIPAGANPDDLKSFLKVIGPNGNSILLPAGGMKTSGDDYLELPCENVKNTNYYQSWGNYWTSSAGTFYDMDENQFDGSYFLRFRVDFYSKVQNNRAGLLTGIYGTTNGVGMSIRPVTQKE